MELSVEEVQEILRVFAESPMQEIHIEVGDVKVVASKRDMPVAPASSTVTAETGGTAASRVVADERPAAVPDEKPRAEPAAAAPDPVTDVPREREGLVAVTAPLLGTFYRCPAPGRPPFVDVGSVVEPDDPVCIVEVMKLFNNVTAGCKGRIAEIVVADGAMVEFGQTLMWIEPADGTG